MTQAPSTRISTPIPAKSADPIILQQFKIDLGLILRWETQQTLADGMSIKRSNFHRYATGLSLVTKNILKRFYDAWGPTINEKRQHLGAPTAQTQVPLCTDIMSVLLRIESKLDFLRGSSE